MLIIWIYTIYFKPEYLENDSMALGTNVATYSEATALEAAGNFMSFTITDNNATISVTNQTGGAID